MENPGHFSVEINILSKQTHFRQTIEYDPLGFGPLHLVGDHRQPQSLA